MPLFQSSASKPLSPGLSFAASAVSASCVPALPPGLTYVEVEGGDSHTTARLGPASTYTTFGAGCAGTLPAAHLVPLDTPRIGSTLQVQLFNLPASVAFMVAGLSNTSSSLGALPLDLTAFGMPGCTAFVSQQFLSFVAGVNNQATCILPIPNLAGLVGTTFYQQAMVLDPGAGNSTGAVMSDAATAVVGS